MSYFDPAEEAIYNNVTFSTRSLGARSRSTPMNVKAIDQYRLDG